MDKNKFFFWLMIWRNITVNSYLASKTLGPQNNEKNNLSKLDNIINHMKRMDVDFCLKVNTFHFLGNSRLRNALCRYRKRAHPFGS